MTIDNELKAEASHALAEAYWKELKALVAKYRAAAAGLGCSVEDGQALVEKHTWGENADGTLVEHEDVNIWTDWPAPGIFGPNYRASCGHIELIEAFKDDRADRIGIEGKIAFVRVDGEWVVAP